MTSTGGARRAAHQARHPRVPRWVGQLGLAGVPEALAGLTILVYNELFEHFPFPGSERSPEAAFVDIWWCLFAGVTGRWPRLGTVGVGIGFVASIALGLPASPTMLTLFIPIVSNAAHGRPTLQNATALTYWAGALAWTIPQTANSVEVVQTIIIWAIMIGLAWLSGRTIQRLRREGEHQFALRGEALRSQRRSIARDLHDTVSYATATMIMRAEQIKLRSTDPELIRDLDFIIATGRRSVRDLRGMMETLRRNDPDLEASTQAPRQLLTPTEALRRQQAELAAHGLRLQISADDGLDGLHDSVREALARLIVEATSNMVKYAARGPCQLIVEAQDDAVEAVFTNQIAAGGLPRTAPGLGLGLVGASERVKALGGELETSTVGSTWILRARLPVGE
ncbi:MAG: hypothetical protein IPL36_14360 [Nigerium sp.]|nr:hypothetical protein [Nigerium sp.]